MLSGSTASMLWMLQARIFLHTQADQAQRSGGFNIGALLILQNRIARWQSPLRRMGLPATNDGHPEAFARARGTKRPRPTESDKRTQRVNPAFVAAVIIARDLPNVKRA